MFETTTLRSTALARLARVLPRMSEALAKQSDGQLVTLTLQGNRDAYGVLVRRHQATAFNSARRIVGDSQDALDVTQDAFVRAYDALASFDRARPFAPWLHTIVARLALNFAQRARRTDALEPEWAADDMRVNPETQVLASEQQARVQYALLQLPPLWRAVVELRHFQELSYAEIADALNLSVSDVKSNLFRARQKLRDLIGESE